MRDLGIFKAEEDSTALFDFVDKTITAGGSYCLRQKFLNPPDSLIDLKKQQETVRLLSGINETSELRLPFNTHQMKSLEEYVSSNINVIENENLLPCILFCLSDIEAYRYVRNSLFEVIRFIYSFDDFLNISENGIEMPRLLQLIKVEIAELKNDIDSVEAINLKNKNRLIFYRVLRADRIFRTRLKSKFQNIINSYSEIDALIAMAKTTSENNFHFPEIVEKEIIFHVDGLFHPLLKNPVPYHLWELWDEISIYSNIRELCFESKVKDGVPVFTYHILQGVSDMRLGMTIITNEKIMDLLNNKENVKN